MDIDQDIKSYVDAVALDASKASRAISIASSKQKSMCLRSIAEDIDKRRDSIREANSRDLNAAGKGGLESALLERLSLDEPAIDKIIEGINQIDLLADPIGEITKLNYQDSGIQVGKMRVPLGVIGMIYESRPNVTIDAASLAIKTGNAVILRGGSESFFSNEQLALSVKNGLIKAKLPETSVQLINTTDRQAVGALLRKDDLIDVIIPRGGKGLIERICNETNISVIKHLDGICHVYIDKEVEVDMAISVAFNSKAEKYGVCNAMETLLVHRDVAQPVLGELSRLFEEKGVELRCCPSAKAFCPSSRPAEEVDWATEYLGPILSIKVLDSLNEAIDHINNYGSHHTDVICTSSYESSRKFIRSVDSASVMVNSSSQFADGFEYGLGAEIGISTDKLHARGPVGLEGLTSEKYVVFGEGEVRSR